MRTSTIEYIYTKPIIDRADSGYLTIDTENTYSTNDYIHDGLIVFSNVFPTLDSWIRIENIRIIQEIRGTGSPIAPPLYLFLFPTAKAQPNVSKNAPFSYSDIFDTNYPLENLMQKYIIASSDWKEIVTYSNVKDQIAEISPNNSYFYSESSQNLFGVLVSAVYTSTPFSANTKLKVQIIFSVL